MTKLYQSVVLGKERSPPQTEVIVGQEVQYGEYTIWYTGIGRKRIDMLFDGEDSIWIIEAKITADWSGIGQVLGYELLFKRDWKKIVNRETLPPIKLGIVCEYADQDIERCCKELGISVFKGNELDNLIKREQWKER